MKPNISIVTVAMNRTDHLLLSAEAASNITTHSEHIILDFGSLIPVERGDLPTDDRIKLYRVESPNGKWWLTHAFNLAFSLASGDFILKLDSDALLSQIYLDNICERQAGSGAHLMCGRLTLQDWSLPQDLVAPSGIFFCKRSSLANLSAFNPYLQGWGWDEVDLYCRFFLSGYAVSQIPTRGITYLQHGDDLREQASVTGSTSKHAFRGLIGSVGPTKRMNAQNYKNKCIAIASLKHQVRWPSLEDYSRSYRLSGELPFLPRLQLFSQSELDSLVTSLRDILLSPSRYQHLFWRLCTSFGMGPYTVKNTCDLLRLCGVDLNLIA